MKKVIAQKQIWHEHGYQNYLASFAGICDLTELKVVPFTNVLEPEIDFIPDLVMGSGRLIRIARERGWPTFDSFDPVEDGIFPRSLWVNHDGVDVTTEQLLTGCYQDEIFIKPYTEKLFTAALVATNRPIFDQVQLTRTVDEIKDEKIFICQPKRMNRETRFFVVGGEVITGSHYKENGEATYAKVETDEEIWELFRDVVMPSCKIPDLTAVVDITAFNMPEVDYLTPKIVEMNNLNSSGVYDTDYDALCRALVNYC